MIPSLARHHLLSIFTCQAINNNITVPSSTSITLDLNRKKQLDLSDSLYPHLHDETVKPTEVRISQLSQVLVADKEAVLECSTFGSRPKAVIYWNFDGQRFNTPLNGKREERERSVRLNTAITTVGALGEHQTSTTITITPRQEHSGAEVTCVAENPKIASSGISDHLRLDVQCAYRDPFLFACLASDKRSPLLMNLGKLLRAHPKSFLRSADIPILSLQLGSPTISLQTIQEGNDIYFDCHIISNPRPNRPILWKFRGAPLHPQPGTMMT